MTSLASAPAIRLKRLVEIYQWKEKKEESKQTKLGGGEETVTTYTYTKAWEDHIEDSSDFKHPEGHQNPERKPYETVEFDSSDVSVGAFKLSSKLIDQMKDFEPLSIDEQSAPLPAGVSKKMKLAGGGIYMGSNPDSPEVGDSRIRFQVVKPGPVSVIGLQTGNSFQSFVSPHGETLMLTDGIKSANEMFAAEASRNATITWILRLCGFIFMWIGFTMLVRPLRVVADVLPFAGELVGFASGAIMLLVAGTISLVTIGIAWLVYRPVLGITLLVMAGGLVFLIVRAKSRAKTAIPAIPRPMNPPPPPIPS